MAEWRPWDQPFQMQQEDTGLAKKFGFFLNILQKIWMNFLANPINSCRESFWIGWKKRTRLFNVFCCCSVTKLCRTLSPWTATHQAYLSFTVSRGLLKLISIEWMMPSNYLILCHPPLLLPSILPSIRVFWSFGKYMYVYIATVNRSMRAFGGKIEVRRKLIKSENRQLWM